MFKQNQNEIIIMWFQHFEILNQSKKNDIYILIIEFTTNLIVIFVDDFDKFFV